MFKTNFPDKNYLNGLVEHLSEKHQQAASELERLLVFSNASMNWIGDYVSAENEDWRLENLKTDNLYLTGTHPEWNKIIIEQCARSPIKLRELLQTDLKVLEVFKEVKFDDTPILVRNDDNQYKVLDGMHRVIAAIKDKRDIIKAYVAYSNGKIRPCLEPHVLYDLFKAYGRNISDITDEDKKALIIVLKFLRKSYTNVDELLRERFNAGWVPDKNLQQLIKKVLTD
ncbi:MAG TPA: hypothetical protein PKZ16_01815 [bacterium]|nr:hypothetical protein [bacterium]HPL95508.1 hypothetical protein [bacterium]